MRSRPVQDVRIWSIQNRTSRATARSPWHVRWIVDGKEFSQAFRTKAQADRYRSRLLVYMVFVTSRSAQVVDTPGKLAVVPKAFHQPTGDHAGEVRLSTTLRREFAEELLGDVDQEGPGQRVDPSHQLGRPEPLTWLLDHPDARTAEATGFGIDIAAGNYVLPCLMVINDEQWWIQFGHMVEANWETQHVRRYSTKDAGSLESLASDPCWCDDGLFALLRGLRRLADTGDPSRVVIPQIEMEL